MENYSKEERIAKINNAEKILREAEKEKVASITREEQYNKEIKKCEEELAKLGTTPEDAPNKIKALEDEMDNLLRDIEAKLPVDVLRSLGKDI